MSSNSFSLKALSDKSCMKFFSITSRNFWKYLAVWSSQKTILKHLRTVGSIVYNCVNYQVFVSLIFCTWNEYRAYLKAVTRKFYMKNMPWKNSKPVAGNFLDKRSNTGVFLWIFRHFSENLVHKHLHIASFYW